MSFCMCSLPINHGFLSGVPSVQMDFALWNALGCKYSDLVYKGNRLVHLIKTLICHAAWTDYSLAALSWPAALSSLRRERCLVCLPSGCFPRMRHLSQILYPPRLAALILGPGMAPRGLRDGSWGPQKTFKGWMGANGPPPSTRLGLHGLAVHVPCPPGQEWSKWS